MLLCGLDEKLVSGQCIAEVLEGVLAISSRGDSGAELRSTGASPGLFLLFKSGERPDRSTILDAISELPKVAVSHDPGQKLSERLEAADASSLSNDWLELLVDGLTFDLIGLAPGPAISLPDVAYRYGLAPDFEEYDGEAIALVPGPHISAGLRTLPVLRVMVGLASALAGTIPVLMAVSWSPARTLVESSAFQKTSNAWLEGGAFPALGLTGLWVNERGAMQSEGLAFLNGQEIELAPEICSDRVAATRLATRVIHELVLTGPVTGRSEVSVAGGAKYVLEAQAGGKVVRITPA